MESSSQQGTNSDLNNVNTSEPSTINEGEQNTINNVIESTDPEQETDSQPDDDSELSDDDEEDTDYDQTWGNLPGLLLEKIYHGMTYCERLRVSSVCKKWRRCMYTPQLWRNVNLYVVDKREGNKAFFLRKVIRFAHKVHIHWPAVYTRGQVHRPRPLDLHNKETIAELIKEMRDCTTLRMLVLKLENPCAFSPDFSRPVQESLELVCRNNERLNCVSFGCNSTIVPPRVLSLMPNQVLMNMKLLHVATVKPSFSNSSLECVPVLTVHEVETMSLLSSLRELSLDWTNVTAEVIQGLSVASQNRSTLKKLNIFVARHECTPTAHPSCDDWATFSSKYPHVKVNLIFVKEFKGVCSSLALIQPDVNTIKVLECHHVDPVYFARLLTWYKETLEVMVFVGVWDSIELDTGPSLWPAVAMCQNIRHLTIIGHYILDEILLFIASNFPLQTFTVSKPHILMLAEATSYLLPSSATKYNQFKQEVGAIIGKPWEALTHIPLEGFYFAEGNDDKVYC